MTLSLQNAAPGTFFALFGTVVIGFTVFRGLKFDASQETKDKSSKKFKQDATSAKQHWQGVWQGLQRLEKEGKIAEDDFSLIRLQLAGLAASLTDITGEQVTEASRKNTFKGFAAPPG